MMILKGIHLHLRGWMGRPALAPFLGFRWLVLMSSDILSGIAYRRVTNLEINGLGTGPTHLSTDSVVR